MATLFVNDATSVLPPDDGAKERVSAEEAFCMQAKRTRLFESCIIFIYLNLFYAG